MKALLTLNILLCLATALNAKAPYGQTNFFRQQKPEDTIAYKILNNQEVTYCGALPQADNITDAQLQQHIAAALKEWTYGTALRIKRIGRAEEFKDLIPVLEKAKFRYLPTCDLRKHKNFLNIYPHYPNNAKPADITVILSTPYCQEFFQKRTPFYAHNFEGTDPFICLFGGEINISDAKTSPSAVTETDKRLVKSGAEVLAKAAQFSYTNEEQNELWRTIRMAFYDEDKKPYFAVIAHEIGHAFGLADQYTAKGEEVLFSSTYRGDSIMAHSYEPIACDETDGIITVFDAQSGKERTFRSFCDFSVLIKNGIQVVASDTPAKFTQTQDGFELDILTPASPSTRTYKKDIGLIDAPLNEDNLAILSGLGIRQSELAGAKTVTLRSTGPMDAKGNRTGLWEHVIQFKDNTIYISALYNNGAIQKLTRKPGDKKDITRELRTLKQNGFALQKRITLSGF